MNYVWIILGILIQISSCNVLENLKTNLYSDSDFFMHSIVERMLRHQINVTIGHQFILLLMMKSNCDLKLYACYVTHQISPAKPVILSLFPKEISTLCSV